MIHDERDGRVFGESSRHEKNADVAMVGQPIALVERALGGVRVY